MKTNQSISAIILAAGFSSRMGGLKPLLPLCGKTVLERCIEIYKRAGITDVKVVVGHRHVELLTHIKNAGAQTVVNSSYRDGMFTSVKSGIKSLTDTQTAFFIHPVDIPLVRRQTVLDLLDAWQTAREQILYPSFLDERGHPPLISTSHSKSICTWHGSGGLRTYLQQKENHAWDVPVADRHVLFDMDTPEDYQKAMEYLETYHIPSTDECMAMMTHTCCLNPSIFDHCLAVARVAVHLSNLLNSAGCKINTALVKAAGLLHDLLRDRPNHAQAVASLLRQMEYAEVADVVADHMEISVQDEAPFHAREVVYLADKLVQKDKLVTLNQRFNSKLAVFSNNPQAAQAVKERFHSTLKIRDRFESMTGKSLDMALSELLPAFTESRPYDLPA